MSEGAEVTLEGPLPAWGGAILRARWNGAPAAVVQGPPSVDPAALALARARAREWVGRHRPAVLPLLGVARVYGREGWVYARPEGVSLAVLVSHQVGRPTVPVASEIVARVCDALLALGEEGLAHPGPHPEDVLLDDTGSIRLAGFVGPEVERAGRHAAEPREAALVRRLGVLLGELLGEMPEDGVWHGILTELGASDTTARPALATVPERLRQLGSADLAAWAADALPAIRRRLEAEWEVPDDERASTLEPSDPEEITEESDLSLVFLGDSAEEVTAASASRFGWPRDVPERGAIPVGVGPPAEAVTGPHRLPADLFDGVTATHAPERPASWRAALWVSVVLAILALVLGAYVVAG